MSSEVIEHYLSNILDEIKSINNHFKSQNKLSTDGKEKIIDEIKKVIPAQYRPIANILKVLIKYLDNPDKIHEDKDKIREFFNNIKLSRRNKC